jgi:hypothetical protein
MRFSRPLEAAQAGLAAGACGAMTNHTVRLADVYRCLTGAEIYAVSNRSTYRDVTTLETGGLLSLVFDDDRRDSIDCSWSEPLNYPTKGVLSFRIITDRGAVDVDVFGQTQAVYGPGEQHTRWDC